VGLILASGSARRQELLSRLGLTFVARPTHVDETAWAHLDPVSEIVAVTGAKARAVTPADPTALILAADTVVVLDGRRIGKPASPAEAIQLLRNLRGGQHTVLTALAWRRGAAIHLETATTTVWMRDYSDAEIAAYVARGEPMDKAGAYAIQDPTFRPVARVEGCAANVMGLPLCRVCAGLRAAGVTIPVPPQTVCTALLPFPCDCPGMCPCV